MAPDRITARLIKDWCWATGSDPVLWERRALLAVDAAWMKETAK